jgi:hypothetical protein
MAIRNRYHAILCSLMLFMELLFEMRCGASSIDIFVEMGAFIVITGCIVKMARTQKYFGWTDEPSNRIERLFYLCGLLMLFAAVGIGLLLERWGA